MLRNQDVTDDIQLAFSRRFGPPEVTKVSSQGKGTPFVVLSTIGPDGNVVPADHRLAMRNKANQLSHTDASFKRVPALASILSARIIPASGGETEFVSTRRAFERVDMDLREQLEKSVRLARLRAFTQSDSSGPCKRRGTGSAPGAVLAIGLEKSGQRARRALPRIPHLRHRRHGRGYGTKADRGLAGGGDRTRHELPAPMAPR